MHLDHDTFEWRQVDLRFLIVPISPSRRLGAAARVPLEAYGVSKLAACQFECGHCKVKVQPSEQPSLSGQDSDLSGNLSCPPNSRLVYQVRLTESRSSGILRWKFRSTRRKLKFSFGFNVGTSQCAVPFALCTKQNP